MYSPNRLNLTLKKGVKVTLFKNFCYIEITSVMPNSNMCFINLNEKATQFYKK